MAKAKKAAPKPAAKPYMGLDEHYAAVDAAAPKLVKMVRDGKSADVHPDMVDDYAAGGWERA
jgi:hypothetical protein